MKPRVVITMEGGLIQDISTDTEMEILVLDFDIEGGDEDRIKTVRQYPDGDEAEAYIIDYDPGAIVDPMLVDFIFDQKHLRGGA